MEVGVNSQKEYLKKYLSSGIGEEKKKKKKKKLKVGQKTVKIIDDDIDLEKLRPIEDGEFDIYLNGEDAPQIAGVVDERGPVDFSDKRKWKIIADDEDGELRFKSSGKERHRSINLDSKEIANKNDYNTGKDSRTSNCDLSPPRRNIKDEDSDVSLPRRSKKSEHLKKSKRDYNSDSSLPKKSREDEDSDLSPPRKNKKSHYSDSKSSKKIKPDYDSDLSPPRKGREEDDSDLSPPRRSKNKDRSNLKQSKRNKHDDDSDLSPPRKSRKNADSDLSPPRKDRRQHSHIKHSKKSKDSRDSYKKYNHVSSGSSHRGKQYDNDQSPPRLSKHRKCSPEGSKTGRWKDDDRRYKHRTKDNNSRSKSRSSRWDDQDDKNESTNEESTKHHDIKMKKTLSGKTAGLQDAKALREESEAFKKHEAEMFSKLSKEITGAGQTAIIRDSKTGRKRDLEAEAAAEREKQQRQEELNKKYEKWGTGLKQVENREEKLKDDLYEMSKPLARYADDADLDKQLREQEREGDPMLAYIRQKQIKEGKRKPDRPEYQGSYMPNRFGIKPGHRWDGVDRSNGYEKKWYDARNAKLARQEEAYKWSTADM